MNRRAVCTWLTTGQIAFAIAIAGIGAPAVEAQPVSPGRPTASEVETFLRTEIKPVFDRLTGRPLQLRIIVRDSKNAINDPEFASLRDRILDGDTLYDDATGTRYTPTDLAAGRQPPPRAQNTEADTAFYRRDARGQWQPADSATAEACIIFTYTTLNFQHLRKIDRGRLSGRIEYSHTNRSEWLYTAAHELYHCYQPSSHALLVGDPGAFAGEGGAEIAAAVAVSTASSAGGFLEDYRSNNAPLGRRDYDAVGLFGHLHMSGVNVFKAFEEIYRASPSQNYVQNFVTAIGPAAQAMWAMSEVDDPQLGPQWGWIAIDGSNTRLRGRERITLDVRPDGQTQAANIPMGQVRILRVLLPENKIVRVSITDASGGVRSDEHGRGGTRDVLSNGQVALCYGDRCPCVSPALGTPGPGNAALTVLKSHSGTALISLLGITGTNGFVDIGVDQPRTATMIGEGSDERNYRRFDRRLTGIWKLDNATAHAAHMAFLERATKGPVERLISSVQGEVTVKFWDDGNFEKTYAGAKYEIDPIKVAATGRGTSGMLLTHNGVASGCLSVERPKDGAPALDKELTAVAGYQSDGVLATDAITQDTSGRSSPIWLHGKKAKLFHTNWAPSALGLGRVLVRFIAADKIEIGLIVPDKEPAMLTFDRVSSDPGPRQSP